MVCIMDVIQRIECVSMKALSGNVGGGWVWGLGPRLCADVAETDSSPDVLSLYLLCLALGSP